MADDAEATTAATSAPTGRPPGISEPLAGISATDQSGLIAILAAFSLGLVLLAVAVRVFARHGFRTYRVDDYTFFAACIFAVVQASLVFRELQQGLGKLEQDIESHVSAIEKLSFTADILYLITLFLSKCSTSFLFLYLTPGRAHMRAIWTTIAASVTWLISSVVLEGIRCHPDHPWTDQMSTCTNSFARWAFIAVFDSLIEIGIVLLAIYIVWGLQMSFGSKLIVVGAFSCRLPNIAISLTRLIFLHLPYTPLNAHTWSARVVSTTQLALGYSVTASIIPYLKPFMMAYERPETSRASHYPSSGSRSGAGSSHFHFKLSALTSKSGTTNTNTLATVDGDDDEAAADGFGAGFRDEGILRENRRERDRGERRGSALRIGKLRPEATKYEVNASAVEHKDEERGDGASDDSQMMIIKKGVEWSVEFDERRSRERGESVTKTEDGQDEITVARKGV